MQRQLEQETHDAYQQNGEWPDDRHLELHAWTRWLTLNIGHTAKDEQRDTFHRQAPQTSNKRVGQFIEKHGDKQQQGRDEGGENELPMERKEDQLPSDQIA